MDNQKYLDFGNRLWGASIIIWLLICFGVIQCGILVKLLISIIVCYFFLFGNSRFTKGYKKII